MAFLIRDGVLFHEIGGQSRSLSEVVDSLKAPTYLYDLADVRERLLAYQTAFGAQADVRYAMKANSHPQLLATIAQVGAGVDVVSAGELKAALAAGVLPGRVVFSGVGKSHSELKLALDSGVDQINVESLPELARLIGLSKARSSQMRGKVRVGLRLNPDLPVNTHPHITTGRAGNKFGLPMAQLKEALGFLNSARDEVSLVAVASHLGSQLMEPEPVTEAADKLVELALVLRGEGWPLEVVDIGGGLGIDYVHRDRAADFTRLEKFARSLQVVLRRWSGRVMLEPGRFLVARAGILLTQVEYVKVTPARTFVIVGSGMNHLIRPVLYQAHHEIVPLYARAGRALERVDVVGPLCESADVLGEGRELPLPKEGEWLAVLDAGAYGRVMASTYNGRELPAEICVDEVLK